MNRRASDTGIDRILRGLQAVTSIAATIALGVATVALVVALVHAGDVATSRRDSARDSCQLLRGLMYAATTKAPKQRAAARAYINHTPLRDCRIYAARIVH